MNEPDLSTRLALDRTRLAYDRTMQASIRTGASLITFGFSVYKFFQLEEASLPFGQAHRRFGSREFATFMVVAGLGTLVAGTIEHRHNLQRLLPHFPGMPRSPVSYLAMALSLMGIVTLLAVIFRQ